MNIYTLFEQVPGLCYIEDYLTLEGHDGQIDAIEYSPDGRSIASGGSDRTVRIWRADGAEWGRPVAAFSPLGARDVFDCAACALLAVSGVAAAHAHATLDWIARGFLDAGALPPAFHPVIDGAPGGISRIAYSAAGVVFLRHADDPAARELLT